MHTHKYFVTFCMVINEVGVSNSYELLLPISSSIFCDSCSDTPVHVNVQGMFTTIKLQVIFRTFSHLQFKGLNTANNVGNTNSDEVSTCTI
jgi:hypothetical protein